MADIKNLNPVEIWRNFDKLTQVPRPSGHLEKIQAYLLDWAKEAGVEAFQDSRQHRDAQACYSRYGEPQRRYYAGAHGHGSSESTRQQA